MAIKGSDKPHALIGQGSVFDGIAYWVTLVGVYVMVGGLMSAQQHPTHQAPWRAPI